MSAPPIVRLPESGASTRGRRPWTILVLAVLVLALLGAAAALSGPGRDTTPLSTLNPRADGARALAQVLAEQGVTVNQQTRTQAVLDRLEATGPGSTTLVIVGTGGLREAQALALSAAAGDVVVLDRGDLAALTGLTDGLGGPGGQPTPGGPGCSDPDAVAADRIAGANGATLTPGSVPAPQVCFRDAAGEGGALVRWKTLDGDRRAVLNPTLVRNDSIAREGNAALVLRVLGAHEHVIWYLPDPRDSFGTTWDRLDDPTLLVTGYLALLAGVLVLWRGRRFGKVVTEPLPVVVPASETTLGLGTLYRRSRDDAHVAAVLRAGGLSRIGARIGLQPSAGRAEVVARVAAAALRHESEIDTLLYGPPPSGPDELAALRTALDTLESEVRHA